MIVKVDRDNVQIYECKHCHVLMAGDETVAYHLVHGILYGWCQKCFNRRAEMRADFDALPVEVKA